MTLNMMLYIYLHEEEHIKLRYINDFGNDYDSMKGNQPIPISEPVCKVNIMELIESIDPTYIKWNIFDKTLDRIYTIDYEDYYFIYHDKYNLCKIALQIRKIKFIREDKYMRVRVQQ